MRQKYKNGTTVYNWSFDLYSNELKCQEATVVFWTEMDGMQWHVIDEYTLTYKTFSKKLKIFNISSDNNIRRPGHLISNDKDYAKLLLVSEVMNQLGYLDTKVFRQVANEGTLKAIETSKMEYAKFKDKYPELIVKSFGEYRPDEPNVGWLWN